MKKILIVILCLMPLSLFAQSVSDYFHTAANHYVKAEKKLAQQKIQEGIQKFPDDAKLKTLAGKIEELPDPEENQNNQQDQKDDQKNDQDQDQQDQKQQQNQQQQISPEDAQRILNALAQEEKELQEKMQKKERAGSRPAIEKNW